MTERGPDWAALGRVFARLPPAWGDAPSAADAKALGVADEDQALAYDLAEERAAIMEYDAGLPRAEAEVRAFKAHGIVPRGICAGPETRNPAHGGASGR